MSTTQQLTEEAYLRLALAEPERKLELYDGEVREKPSVSWEHSELSILLGHLLLQQLDRRKFSVLGESRVRRSPASVYIPDLMVVPAEFRREFRDQPGRLAVLRDPLPLVVEIWSRSTGDYDVNAKIPEYRRRGDLEIWRIHPCEKSITAWRRQPDGSYNESTYYDGIILAVALPNVTIDLAALFDEGNG